MKDLLLAAGFTDIIEHDDGTVDVTKDGVRFTHMYASDRSLFAPSDVISVALSHGGPSAEIQVVSTDAVPPGHLFAITTPIKCYVFTEKKGSL